MGGGRAGRGRQRAPGGARRRALADRTGWGEALFGIVMTGVSAADGHPHLAYRDAVGGIAVQTLAIVAADAAYRRVNLEHAAASVPNLLFGCLLIVLLSTALLAAFTPEITVLGVHPASAVMVARTSPCGAP